MTSGPLLDLTDIHLTYRAAVPIRALRGISLQVDAGEFVAIEGPSGGGKSSLLNIVGLLGQPTSGGYILDGIDTTTLTDAARTELRACQVSFVFQSFHLLNHRPAIDSVELGLLYRNVTRAARRERASDGLHRVGLAAAIHQDASTLSGGQQQRVAIARTLASNTPILIADEPTGNLDSASSRTVLESLLALRELGTTIIVATHEIEVARLADRTISLVDGQIAEVTLTRSERPPRPAIGATRAGEPRRKGMVAAGPVPHRRIGWTDTLLDAVASLRSKRWRTVALSFAVAVAVGLAVASQGLAASSNAQVSSTFDARANKYVTIEDHQNFSLDDIRVTGWQRADAAAQLRQVKGIAGVDSAAILEDHDQNEVTAALWRTATSVRVFVGIGDFVKSTESTVSWAGGAAPSGADYVLVGRHVAERLELGPIDGQPVVYVNGSPHGVTGILEASARLPDLAGDIVFVGASPPDLAASTHSSVIIVTQSGAAQQVAAQAPLAIDPVDPAHLSVSAPTDPRDLRASVEHDVRVTLIVFTLIAALAAVAGLANAMVLAVSERRQEFGLRRAVGARPRDLAALVLNEAAMVGMLGGGIGLALGVLGVLGVTIANRWTPVLDPASIPVAAVGGVLVGALGGLAAAIQAAKTEPAIALRQ